MKQCPHIIPNRFHQPITYHIPRRWTNHDRVSGCFHNDSTERRLLRLIENSIQDFEFYTTTVERLLDPENIHKPVWRDVFAEEDEDEQPELRGL